MRPREPGTGKIIAVFIICIIALSVIATGAFLVHNLFSRPNEEMAEAFEDDSLKLVIEGNLIKSENLPRLIDEEIYLPLEFIMHYIDKTAFWDQDLHKLTVATGDQLIRMETDSLDAYVNNKLVTLNYPLREFDGIVYVPVKFFAGNYGLEIKYTAENNIIIIDFSSGVRKMAEALSDEAVIRTGMSIKEPILKKLKVSEPKSDTLRVFEEYEGWYKVRTAEGIIGFIEKRFVVVKLGTAAGDAIKPELNKTTAWKPERGKMTLVWDYMNKVSKTFAERGKTEGLDIISPTWFKVTDAQGNVKSLEDTEYVDWAHNNSYKVWALFSNDFADAEQTGRFLRNTDARDNSMRQILEAVGRTRIDGINIDFENLKNEDRDILTQYVREITPLLHQLGVVVSIDINGLPCYDREALGDIVDYVMLMAYDQHWAGGGVAGSVSQLSWAETTLRSVLRSIPSDKLILGIPFYCRVWTEKTGTDEKKELTTKALSMEQANKLIFDNKASVEWEFGSGQFFVEYELDGAKNMLWLEDANSVNLRTSLVLKYDLAGVAAWRLGHETSDVWPVINNSLKTLASYTGWKSAFEDKKYEYSH